MADPSPSTAVEVVQVLRRGSDTNTVNDDRVAVERALEIRVLRPNDPAPRSVSVTMRSPGHDGELAVGFLLSEGAIAAREDVLRVSDARSAAGGDTIRVSLRGSAPFDPEEHTRNVYATSSCGVCGVGRLERVRATIPLVCSDLRWTSAQLAALPTHLRARQVAFDATGGTHGAALVQPDGGVRYVREDVGRHNAMDKLLGRVLLDGLWPMTDVAVVLSGRASFELVQKALVLGARAIVSVGAPSSAAVSLAREHGALLAGFVRKERFNLYAGFERVSDLTAPQGTP